MHGEAGIKAAQASNKVILPSANHFFGGVASMIVRRYELEGGLA